MQLARNAGLDRFVFLRIYRRVFGITPIRHLQQMRVEAARTLLATTDLTVAEIGRRVGLTGHGYLSRLLRRTTGMGPRALRRSHGS